MTDSPFASPNRVRPGGRSLDDRIASRALTSTRVAVHPWDDGVQVEWFVSCSRRDLEQVLEELRAHVGVSFTDFHGELIGLDPSLEADRWADTLAGDGPVARVSLLEPDAHRQVSMAFLRWLDLWEGRPETRRPPRRPTAELLTEYRLALGAGQRRDAQAVLRELRASGALDVINVHYLELELLDRFDGAAAVLGHPRLDALLQIRRPARVTDIIARAVDRTHLRPDDAVDVDTVRGRFVRLTPGVGALLTTPGECRSAAGALLVGLHLDRQGRSAATVTQGLPPGVVIDDRTGMLLAGLASRHETPIAHAEAASARIHATAEISAPAPPPVPAAPPPTLAEFMVRGEFDRVLDMAELSVTTDSVDFELLDAALRAAQWLDSIDAARRALNVLDAAPREVAGRFTEGRLVVSMVAELRSLVSNVGSSHAVSGWADLFEVLVGEPTWRGAVAAAEHGVLEWPVGEVAQDPGAVSRLAREFIAASDAAAPTFAQLVPHLVDWLSRADGASQPALLDVGEAVLTYLALNDQTRSGLSLLGDLAGRLVETGLPTDRYAYCLDGLEERWTASASPAGAGWVCETLELLLDQPCPDIARRRLLATRLLSNPGLGFHRVDASLQDLLRSVANEYDLGELVPTAANTGADEEDDVPRSAHGVTIGLYSLTVGALQRAKANLERRWPGLVVETRSDKRASKELASLAQRADAMVVAWRSSKHPATDCIDVNRDPARPAIMAEGKGSASLIRAAEDFLSVVVR